MDHHTTQISALTRRLVECVGPVFLSFWQVEPGISDDALTLQEEEESEDELTSTFVDPDDVNFLRSLDPKEWKEQDHYAVLGLKKLRHKATEDDIKKAYRLKVLRHHPDKRKAQGEEIRPDDDYFTCITKAWEILGNPRNRRSYDSVDKEFDDSIPTGNEHTRNNFYEVFGKAFDLNSRWSEKMPVPKLGNESTSRENVERFYSFWYNFESWREYSYLDEEEKEQGQGREERKWIEKQNKAARAKRKKEEMARIRSLVDIAYSLDPRIQKFKQEDKDRKLAVKQAKKDAARARQEEEDRRAHAAEEEMRKQKEEAEAEQKAKQDAIKAEREAQKRALKKERASLRKLAKGNDYYSVDPSEMVHHMASLEKICECLRVDELEELVTKLTLDGREAFLQAMEETERRIERERQELMESATRSCGGGSGTTGRSKKGSTPWTHEQLQLLIKAVNVFPAGTNQRWEVVANFINQHTVGDFVPRTPKEVLAKAKDLQSCDYSRNILKVAANQKAYDNFEKDQKVSVEVSATTSQRFDSPADQQGIKITPWTAIEQQLLEQALKTYPASTSERWDRIAECLPTRSKKDCMRRYKELVEMVKAKKAAQAAIAPSKSK
ncbi:dnaJ homolog subfamily C member 2 isoform X2 [Zootermopsis nevadensis]|uniref:dnaJ homolog subfamily C member 2 isoform X2 n=1 Tax=Zootermopsis nevadensis TaxID=136037 RepID=UPI000B8E2C97|nr:dnaJ homolog subfamily C member 2 isoform X2 [Zootermopsis nevadensis]